MRALCDQDIAESIRDLTRGRGLELFLRVSSGEALLHQFQQSCGDALVGGSDGETYHLHFISNGDERECRGQQT